MSKLDILDLVMATVAILLGVYCVVGLILYVVWG